MFLAANTEFVAIPQPPDDDPFIDFRRFVCTGPGTRWFDYVRTARRDFTRFLLASSNYVREITPRGVQQRDEINAASPIRPVPIAVLIYTAFDGTTYDYIDSRQGDPGFTGFYEVETLPIDIIAP